MITAREKVIKLINDNDIVGAMRIVSKWRFIGNCGDIIKTGWDAKNHADFYRQIKKNPNELWEKGVSEMKNYLGVK